VSPNPDFNDKSYYSHLDKPPSPNGPEKNVIAATVVVTAVDAHGVVGDFAAGGGGTKALSSLSVGPDAPLSLVLERTAAMVAALHRATGLGTPAAVAQGATGRATGGAGAGRCTGQRPPGGGKV